MIMIKTMVMVWVRARARVSVGRLDLWLKT